MPITALSQLAVGSKKVSLCFLQDDQVDILMKPEPRYGIIHEHSQSPFKPQASEVHRLIISINQHI